MIIATNVCCAMAFNKLEQWWDFMVFNPHHVIEIVWVHRSRENDKDKLVPSVVWCWETLGLLYVFYFPLSVL